MWEVETSYDASAPWRPWGGFVVCCRRSLAFLAVLAVLAVLVFLAVLAFLTVLAFLAFLAVLIVLAFLAVLAILTVLGVRVGVAGRGGGMQAQSRLSI